MLRKNQFGGYRLIGECFVNGFMDGEAIEGLEGGKFQVETFEIFWFYHRNFSWYLSRVVKYLGSYPSWNITRFKVG